MPPAPETHPNYDPTLEPLPHAEHDRKWWNVDDYPTFLGRDRAGWQYWGKPSGHVISVPSVENGAGCRVCGFGDRGYWAGMIYGWRRGHPGLRLTRQGILWASSVDSHKQDD